MQNKSLPHWTAYEADDGYIHHQCSECKTDAIFEYESEPMYEEDYDGEWHYIADCVTDIIEYLTPYCPYCGAKLNEDLNDEVEYQ